MSGTYAITMGDRGRLVIPQDLRNRLGLDAGSPLALVETPEGILLLTREQLKGLVRRDLTGPSLVEALIEDRVRAAAQEGLGGSHTGAA